MTYWGHSEDADRGGGNRQGESWRDSGDSVEGLSNDPRSGAVSWSSATGRSVSLVVITGAIAAMASWLVAWVAARMAAASINWAWMHRASEPPITPDATNAALLAFLGAFGAAGFWWALTSLTPNPQTFFRPALWLCAALIVIAIGSSGAGGWWVWLTTIAVTAAPTGLISMGISTIAAQHERENDDSDF